MYIAARAWGGTSAAIKDAYDQYFETFQFMVKNDISCVGFEQPVLVVMCQIFTSLCCIQYSVETIVIGLPWVTTCYPTQKQNLYVIFELNRTGHKLVSKNMSVP
jgi:hypothetical protein|mmetsp:Transcript_10126/g.18393  ORF Transcript_10126/g.18393 Transcript_10126/m.18393 type:complete len:104 (-) Transcript_10126:158-469(-)